MLDTDECIYYSCSCYYYSPKRSYNSFHYHISDISYHHNPHLFHLDFWCYHHMFQWLKLENRQCLKFINVRHSPTHILFLQEKLTQSLFLLQAIVLLHFGHTGPPQSISVSSWFFIWSSQVSTAIVREFPLCQFYEAYVLTNTFIIVANIAHAVTISFASLHIFTFWTFESTTINISLVSIFDTIRTAWN